MAVRGERGALRVLEKLEASVNSGQYYEAHQMYRTLYFRYSTQKKYPDLLNLLNKGAMLLLKNDQQGSGSDLAILFIDVLTKSETKPNEEWIEKVGDLFELMSPGMPERELFLTNAVKWSMDDNKKGHPLLHKRVAEVFWREKKFPAAHRHFLHSNDGCTYATMLVELHSSKGLKSEIDLFITQAVLQILCLRNLKMALDAFYKYNSSHPKIKNDSQKPPYLTPLLNFLWHLMHAIEERNITQFKLLRKIYAINIKRDPFYSEYLDNIGCVWFGIEIRKNTRNSNSVFGGLIKSMIGDMDSSDDEGFTGKSAPAPDLD